MTPAPVTLLRPATLTLVVDRCQDLRTERDEALAAEWAMAAEVERLGLELNAERARRNRPGAPWWPLVLAWLAGVWTVIIIAGVVG